MWFFVFVPALLVVHFFSLRKIERKAMLFANYRAMEEVFGRKIIRKNYPLLILRILILVFLILSISGTVLIYEGPVTDFDFVLAIDASASMLANDYVPDRLTAAKDAALMFVDMVPEGTDVGVLSFAGTAFVKQQLTDDKEKLSTAISDIDVELVGGTAIGQALVSSSELLLPAKKKKAIILLTDGENNIGISIEDALKQIDQFSITIDTIGIGTEEGGMLANTSFFVGLDSNTLQNISEDTGGSFFRAKTASELRTAFETIATGSDQKIHMDLTSYMMLIALVLFLAELLLVNTKFRTIP